MKKWRKSSVSLSRFFSRHEKPVLNSTFGSRGAPSTTIPTIPNTTQLLSLPNELILLIVENLDHPKDISALIQTNRCLAHLLTPILHKLALESKNGTSAIHWAAARGHEPLVRLILEKGGDVNENDWMGRTPLHQAMESCHAATIKLLLEKGANVAASDLVGCTPLHTAMRGYTAVLGYLKAAKIGSVQYWENRPLAAQLHESAIRTLLQHGADPNAQTREGDTVLHCATKYRYSSRNPQLIKLLLDKGANPLLKNSRQYKASDHMRDWEEAYKMIKRREWIKDRGYIYASILHITGGYRKMEAQR